MTFRDGTGIGARHQAVGAARTPASQHGETIVKRLAGLVAAQETGLGEP